MITTHTTRSTGIGHDRRASLVVSALHAAAAKRTAVGIPPMTLTQAVNTVGETIGLAAVTELQHAASDADRDQARRVVSAATGTPVTIAALSAALGQLTDAA